MCMEDENTVNTLISGNASPLPIPTRPCIDRSAMMSAPSTGVPNAIRRTSTFADAVMGLAAAIE